MAEDYSAIAAAVATAMANSEVMRDLTAKVHELTSPQPQSRVPAAFTDEEHAAMAKAVTELRARKAKEAQEAAELANFDYAGWERAAKAAFGDDYKIGK